MTTTATVKARAANSGSGLLADKVATALASACVVDAAALQALLSCSVTSPALEQWCFDAGMAGSADGSVSVLGLINAVILVCGTNSLGVATCHDPETEKLTGVCVFSKDVQGQNLDAPQGESLTQD